MKKEARGFISLLLVFGIAAISMSCSSPTGSMGSVKSNQTPVAGDFTITNLSQTAGSVTAVNIRPKSGKSPGAISNIHYAGSATIPQTAGTYAVTFDVAAAAGWNAAVGLSAGNLVVTAPSVVNQTPVAGDYTFGNLNQTAGSVTAVTITPNSGKSSGARTIYYTGTSGTTYARSATIPQVAGTYAVTFNVAAATGWNAATNLSAGNLTVNAVATTQTPVAGDYTITNLSQTAGSVTAVSITPNTGKSSGARTIYYTGTSGTTYARSATIPQVAGTYAVTFDVAAATGWNAATGLSAGTLTVTAPSGGGGGNQTPVVSDYTISGNTTQTVGSVTAVTITPNSGKSSGVVTVYYTGTGSTTYAKSTTVPSAAGTYAVTFDVAAAAGWSAATGLPAGTLVVYTPVVVVNQTPVAGDFNITNLNQTAGNVTAVTITPKSGKSSGRITIYYTGTGITNYGRSSTIPQDTGTYDVTFNVGLAAGWVAVNGLSAGSLIVINQTPVAGDYTIGNINQIAESVTPGTVTAVTISRKNGKSDGAISNIRYDGNSTIPQTVGMYAVTFDVAAFTNWNAATGLSAGDLILTSPFIIAETSTVAITGYTGASKDVTIPAQINSKNVTTIGDNAFNNKQLNIVRFPPNNLTSIGNGAFADNRLTGIIIPGSVTRIENDAFYNNRLMTSVTIPGSVVYIGNRAFYNNGLTGVTIPNSVTYIGLYAFSDNQLTSVTISNTVTTIEEGAFRSNQLTSVTIPNSVTTIGLYAFSGNPLLTSVTIGGNVTIANSDAFPPGFNDAYNNGGKVQGTYNFSEGKWTKQ